MRAIVMDDSRVMRMILRRALEGLSFDVVDFPDARTGLEWLLHGGTADVALVDWNMPVMSGLEFIVEVRKIPALDQMYLLMVTSETAQERMQLALASGADEYMMKPITADGLKTKLELLGFRWADTPNS